MRHCGWHYTETGDTLLGTHIHTIKHCDFTVIYFDIWDHVENTSVSHKGSNPPFSGVRLLFSSQCICHNWHMQRNKAEYATNSVTEAAYYKLLSISCILKWMSRRYFLNEHKYPCVHCQCFYAGKTSIMCHSWQTHKIAFTALNTRRIAALCLHEHFKSSLRNASSLDVLLPILHVKTCTGS